MIEIPESKNLEVQSQKSLLGKKIKKVFNASSPHKFCWFYGDPLNYDKILKDREITGAKGHGMYLDLYMDRASLTIGDGTVIKFNEPFEKKPEKYQLLTEFYDGSFLTFNVAMYGGIWAYERDFDNKYYQGSLNSVSPLTEEFNEKHFEGIFKSVTKDLSAKAFLATEQRIPGLGNGVLQDILLTSSIHPKRKMSTLTDSEKDDLFYNLKAILEDMANKGGRDTEKDLFGKSGGYKTLLSKNSCNEPCRLCGDKIIKESYLGGSVYYCPTCQKL